MDNEGLGSGLNNRSKLNPPGQDSNYQVLVDNEGLSSCMNNRNKLNSPGEDITKSEWATGRLSSRMQHKAV